MRIQSSFHSLSQKEKEQIVQSILSDPREFVQEFQKYVQRVDNHRLELTRLSAKKDRLERVSEILREG